MARFRRKRSVRKSPGGGGGSRTSNMWAGPIAIIMGAVALVICLITFGIAIDQLDSSLTTAATYTLMVGLPEVMGVFGMIIFLVFMALGLGALAGGTYMQWKQATSGSWTDIFMVAVMGGVSIVITLVINGVALSQLNTAMGTVNSTTNYATYFTGLYSVMGVWGLVVFISLMGASLAQFAAAGYAGYKKMF